MNQRVLLPLFIGIIGFGIALGVAFRGGPLTLSAQVGVSDLLMVRAGGPRLGKRPIRDDIVLVLYDFKSAQKIGYVHSYVNDVTVFRNLISAGADLVFDTRMVAAADAATFTTIQPMLDQMLEINNDGRLSRDVWLSSDLLAETAGRYNNLLTQNVVNSHPHANPNIESRLYPLVYFTSNGPAESAPLTILRRAQKLPRATPDEVGAELMRSGIMSVWHQHAPAIVPKTDVPKSAYQIGERKIDWHGFQSTTSLIPPAAFWVSYDPPAAEYKRHSFVDVMAGASTDDFKGKCVIVGYDAEIDPTSDTFAIPSLPGKASAAELVACATQTLLDDRTMGEFPRSLAVVTMAVMTFCLALVAGLMKPLHAAATSLLVLLAYFALATMAYRSGWYADFAVTPACAGLTAVVAGIGNAWQNLRLRRRILDLFGRYVPRAVVNQLMLRPELKSLTLGGVKREVTVMFADIRGFTTFSQALPPEDVVRQLNALLEIMVTCTFENEGTLDKFIGDAILVLFNAPLDQADHSERAVRTAVSIQQRLAGHGSGLCVGIGVHRGDAVVGNIGTPQRMEYTAIGSTVNIASRLCDFAKPGDVVLSQQVLEAISDKFATESLGQIQVKGISNPLEVARVILTANG